MSTPPGATAVPICAGTQNGAAGLGEEKENKISDETCNEVLLVLKWSGGRLYPCRCPSAQRVCPNSSIWTNSSSRVSDLNSPFSPVCGESQQAGRAPRLPTLPTQGQRIPLPIRHTQPRRCETQILVLAGLGQEWESPALFPCPLPHSLCGQRGSTGDFQGVGFYISLPGEQILTSLFSEGLISSIAPLLSPFLCIFPHQLFLTLSASISSVTQPLPHKPRLPHFLFI